MANSLTNFGEQVMLTGSGADGSIARIANSVRLYINTSTPNKNGTGFNQVPNGNGYLTGGIAIVFANWTLSLVSLTNQIALTSDPSWTASGGSIANIAGAFITAGASVMAWWERTPFTLLNTETLTLDDLTIRL